MRCLCATSRHVARALTRLYEEELKQIGLSAAQFELLSTLQATSAIPQSTLAKTLDLDQTTLSRNISVLVERQWVERSTSGKDRRQSVYNLSKEGRRIWRRAIPYWQRAQRKMQRALGDNFESALETLSQLTSAAES